eukprot:g1667.t1
MPDSFGNCGSRSPPSPCQDYEGGKYLFDKHKKWEYKATARWVSGLNTMNLTKIELGANSNGNLTGLQVMGLFAHLPTSIHIQQCVTFDKCSNVFDNTHACCGSNKHFSVVLNVACNADKELNLLSLSDVTIDTFKITESMGGIKLPSYDITNPVRDAVTSVLKHYLNASIIPVNGEDVTLVEFLNAYGKDFLPQIC